MPNRYYNANLGAAALTLIRSSQLNGQFTSVGLGFDALQTDYDATRAELLAARQGQATLSANLSRYLSTAAPAAGSMNMGGYRITGAADGVAASDYATVNQLTQASFSGVLPALIGNAGKSLRVNDAGTAVTFDNPSVTTLTGNATLSANRRYCLNSNAAAFTVTLPPGMAAGDWVELVDVGGALATKNVTVARGSYTIRALAEDLILDLNWDSVRLINTAAGIFEA